MLALPNERRSGQEQRSVAMLLITCISQQTMQKFPHVKSDASGSNARNQHEFHEDALIFHGPPLTVWCLRL